MKNSGSSKFIVITIVLTIIAIIVVGFLIFKNKTDVLDDVNIPSSIGSFFPFGNSNNTDRELDRENTDIQIDNEITFPQLRKLTDVPTAGATAFQRGDDIIVRYVEKSTGHIYELPMSQEKATRLVNRTVPGIHDAFWERGGNQVIMRFLNDENVIKSYSTIVPDVESPTAPEGNFLPDNLDELLPSQSSANILYLYKEGDSSYGQKADFTNTNPIQLFSSNFQEWLLDWPNNTTITATSKPSYNIDGHTYLIDISNNTFNKVIGNKPALVTKLNPYTNKLLFSSTGENGHIFGVYNLDTGKELQVALATTPDKCVWSALDSVIAYCSTPLSFKPIGFPDTWYKGQVSYNDTGIWRLNADTLALDSVRFAEHTSENIDAIKFFMDPNETYIYFFNKKDMSLWSYELKEPADIEIQNTINIEEKATSTKTTASSTKEKMATSTSEVINL